MGDGGDSTGMGRSVREGVREADKRRTGVDTDLLFSGRTLGVEYGPLEFASSPNLGSMGDDENGSSRRLFEIFNEFDNTGGSGDDPMLDLIGDMADGDTTSVDKSASAISESVYST
jgi:hypothetical protein